MSNDDVRGFEEIDRTQVALVGGKGANLGELSRIEGVRVPEGCCVTTHVFERIVAEAALDEPLERLSQVDPRDHDAVRTLSAEIRRRIEQVAVPDDVAVAVTDALARLGEHDAYAVRSSATAEDLPTASFAGQQDTYLNVVGAASVLEHVRRCWASLFTERAVTYRQRNGVDHRKVHMAVVVQRMVTPHASGVLFTADPVTGSRSVTSIEASYGLGEALVSGLVEADSYQVRDDAIVARTIGTKQLAVRARPGGGTQESVIDPAQQGRTALTDEQVLQLSRLGRRIEAHFDRPQDIEWCLVDDEFQIVQSRPITTLYPIPASDDGANHVYVSVGHGQMMTDPMKPLGLSLFQLTAGPPMLEAGGRLWVDVTDRLASPATREGLLEVMGNSDPLLGDALRTIVGRDGFLPSASDETAPPTSSGDAPAASAGAPAAGAPAPIATDPAIVAELIERTQASIDTVRRDIRGLSGPELIDFVLADIPQLKQILFDPESHRAIMAGMEATWWLNDQLQEWLGEKNLADTLTLSVPHNVTSEMGLALLDVADVVRPHPEVVGFLREVERSGGHEGFLDEMDEVEGGRAAQEAIRSFLHTYGMRCVGEIDITKPRWSERPTTLVPVILGNVDHFEPGEGERRFEQGRLEAEAMREEVLERLRALPDGAAKADEAERMIDRVRTFAGFREYPKYGIVCRYLVYKQALMAEAARQVQAHVLREPEDIFFLTFQELRDVVRGEPVDHRLIEQRMQAFRSYEALTPPRVLTSDGEAVTGVYRRDDLPDGALAGLAVSAGTVEGRARVIHDMSEAELEPGDILVTAFTDPSWSPLFVSIAGLVTEVGGLMTHGAVIAREYGLPAVVGVEQATRRIEDGQRIRVHGTEGYVELLD